MIKITILAKLAALMMASAAILLPLHHEGPHMTTSKDFGGPPVFFGARTVFSSPGAMQDAYHKVISADVASTVPMPDGRILWLTGDATVINGKPVWLPHNNFVMQSGPGSLVFTALTSPTFGSYQQVPNWPDGSVFWPSAGAVDNGVLHVFGVRVTLGRTAWDIHVVGNYDATFAIAGQPSRFALTTDPYLAASQVSLIYQGVAAIPFGVSSVVQGSGGWWLVGTDNVGGAGCVFNCYQAHASFVSTGQLGNYSAWPATTVIIPAGLNIGGVVDMVRNASGGWTAWTKTDDIMGSTIQRMNASTFTGTWAITGTWPAPNLGGAGTGITYGVRIHPNQGAPPGSSMITVIENDSGYYGPQFVELPDS